MRSLLAFLVLTVSSSVDVLGQPKDCDNCIEWAENRKLTWSDFKGKAKQHSPNEALTDSGMSIELDCNGNSAKAVVTCYFNPNSSWAKSKESAYLLRHEQLHFDITELFVRKLRKELVEFSNDCDALNDHIEEYYHRNYKEFVAFQDQYDQETKHSLNEEKQAYWERKVAEKLAELKYYATLAGN